MVMSSNISRAQSQANTEQLPQLLPASDWKTGWEWESAPMYFYPENLFEYINGSADLYLAYGFQALATIGFLDEQDVSVLLDIYDMGTPLNAFGIYSNYRNPESTFEPLGTEATVSDYHIRFYQGQYVVDLNTSDASEAALDFMRKLAREISSRIDAPKEAPQILSLLPPKNLIDKTQKYIAEGLLGQQFLPRGLEAAYELNGDEVKAFITLCASMTEADSAFSALANYVTAEKDTLVNARHTLMGKLPYHGFSLIGKLDRFIYGVIDLGKPEQGLELMTELQHGISAFIDTENPPK